VKNSAGGAEPDNNSPTIGDSRNKARAGGIRGSFNGVSGVLVVKRVYG